MKAANTFDQVFMSLSAPGALVIVALFCLVVGKVTRHVNKKSQ